MVRERWPRWKRQILALYTRFGANSRATYLKTQESVVPSDQLHAIRQLSLHSFLCHEGSLEKDSLLDFQHGQTK